jgi:hypothetical protein
MKKIIINLKILKIRKKIITVQVETLQSKINFNIIFNT